MIKAILFDMNGVIINDEHIHEMAFHNTLEPYGIDLDHQLYLTCCAGRTDQAGYEAIAARFNKKLPIDVLLNKKSELYLHLFPTHKKSYPDVVTLITSLSHNFQLALTSSSSRAEVDLITKEFSIKQLFRVTISGDDVQRGKPDPEPYLLTAARLGVQPHECLVIEDSQSGITSAKTAGCYCVGITTTHTREELRDANRVVDTFREITLKLIEDIAAHS